MSDPALWEFAERGARLSRYNGSDGGTGPAQQKRRQRRSEIGWYKRKQLRTELGKRGGSMAIAGRNETTTRTNTGEIRKEKEEAVVGRELFLFPWPSVALALWDGGWGARMALPMGRQGIRRELRVLVGGLPCLLGPPFPCRPSSPGRLPGQHQNGHSKPQHPEHGSARHLPQRDSHACQGMCRRVHVDGWSPDCGASRGRENRERQPGNVEKTGSGLFTTRGQRPR